MERQNDGLVKKWFSSRLKLRLLVGLKQAGFLSQFQGL